MLYIFLARKGSCAPEVQPLVIDIIGQDCEHGLIQERKEGCYKKKVRLETYDEMIGRYAKAGRIDRDVAARLFANEQPTEMLDDGETKVRTARKVFISPNVRLADGTQVTLDDFPDEWSFGNGVNCCARVKLSDGEVHRLSWAVFPDSAASTVQLQKEQLCVAFEG